MDQHNRRPPKKVPLRRKLRNPSESNSSAEGTFIPLATRDSEWIGVESDFVNPNYVEIEEEEEEQESSESLIAIIGPQEEKPPLLLLFPDLENEEKTILTASTSTTQIVQVLAGKKADFSLLKPSKKLDPQVKLAAIAEEEEEQ